MDKSQKDRSCVEVASPQDSQGSVELSRVCTVLHKVHQRVLCDGITPDKAHIEEHSLQVGQGVTRSL